MKGKQEKPYTMTQAGGICFTSDRDKNPEIRVDNWIYDLWLPLLGATVMGVYTLYCRLDNGDRIWGMTLDDISRICRIGKKTLMDIHLVLEECKFIVVKRPTGINRLKHFTTEIRVLTPPKTITPEVIAKYQHPQGYQAVTRWLVKEDVLPDSSIQHFGDSGGLDETNGSSIQHYQEVLHDTTMDQYLSRSIPLEDQPSMHGVDSEKSTAQPEQTGMDGWMDEYQNPKFIFLMGCDVMDINTIRELMVLPLETLQNQWAIVKNSTKINDKPGMLVTNLRKLVKLEAAKQRAAAERAANPEAAQTPTHAHADANRYQRPDFITEAEWDGLSDIPAVYELLDGATFDETTGSLSCRTPRHESAFFMKYNGAEISQRFAAIRNWRPDGDDR